VVVVFLFANGKIDPYYLRFTTPKKHSLVVGNSRAAQGIMPHILDSCLNELKFDGPLFNYSFTISTTPHGPHYLESIKRKLDKRSRNGLFILSVDPWSISGDAKIEVDHPRLYSDAKRIPNNMRFVNINPNWEYLFRNYDKAWGSMILKNMERKQMELHEN